MKSVKQLDDRILEISTVWNQKFLTETKKKIRKIASDKFQIPNYLNGFEHAVIWKEDDDDDEKYEDNESEK